MSKQLSGSALAAIRRRAEYLVINCAPIDFVVQRGDRLEIILGECDHANVVDSLSLTRLLAWLQAKEFVSNDTQAMWVGFTPEKRLMVWCVV
jgi:hypothetical protein